MILIILVILILNNFINFDLTDISKSEKCFIGRSWNHLKQQLLLQRAPMHTLALFPDAGHPSILNYMVK